MSVFGGMDDYGNDPVKPFLVMVNINLGRLFSILTKARGALGLIGSILHGIVTLLKQLSNAATAAANVLRLNPLASGPVKVLVTIVVAFLKGAAKALDAVAATVEAVRDAFNRTVKARIQNLIDSIRAKVLLIIDIDGKIQEVVSLVQRIARFLKKQEDLGNFPPEKLKEIQEGFKQRLYDVVPVLQQRVKEIEAELEPVKKAIERIKDEIDAVEAALSPLASMVAAFNATVGFVLGKISDFAQAVKAWIDDKIAWLGWLLDGIETLIEKALNFLGMNTFVDWLKKQLGNVPFIKEAQEFRDQIAALREQLERELNEVSNKLINIGQEIYEKAQGSAQGQTNETLAFILRQGIGKGVLEWVLPERIQALIEKLLGAIEKLKAHQQGKEESESGNEIQERELLPPQLVSDLQVIGNDLAFVRRYALCIKDAPIKLEPLTNIFHHVAERQEQFDLSAPFIGKKRVGAGFLAEQLSAKLSVVSALQKDATDLMQMNETLGGDYFQELTAIVKSLSEDQRHLVQDQMALRELLAR